MRLTIKSKLTWVIGILLGLFGLFGLFSYLQILNINSKVREITEIAEPTSAAAYEMEINLIGTGFGLLGYLYDHDPKHLERIVKDEIDFETFQAKYHELAETAQGKEWGVKVDLGYEKFRDLAEVLVAIEDRQTQKMEDLLANLNRIDDLLDDSIQAAIQPNEPQAYQKLHAALDMEININGIAKGLGNYLRTHKTIYEDRVHKDEQDFRHFIQLYKNLPLSLQEQQWAQQVESLFNVAVKSVKEIIVLDRKKNRSSPNLSRSGVSSTMSSMTKSRPSPTKTSLQPNRTPSRPVSKRSP